MGQNFSFFRESMECHDQLRDSRSLIVTDLLLNTKEALYSSFDRLHCSWQFV